MSNIFIPHYAGLAYVKDGVAYEYVGSDTGQATSSTLGNDAVNIGSITYTYADSRSKQIYTAGENALSYYLGGTAQFPDNRYTNGPGTHNVFTAEVDGVARIWRQQFDRMYINGIQVTRPPTGGQTNAYAYDLVAGDTVAFREDGSSSWVIGRYTFLPFNYTPGDNFITKYASWS